MLAVSIRVRAIERFRDFIIVFGGGDCPISAISNPRFEGFDRLSFSEAPHLIVNHEKNARRMAHPIAVGIRNASQNARVGINFDTINLNFAILDSDHLRITVCFATESAKFKFWLLRQIFRNVGKNLRRNCFA